MTTSHKLGFVVLFLEAEGKTLGMRMIRILSAFEPCFCSTGQLVLRGEGNPDVRSTTVVSNCAVLPNPDLRAKTRDHVTQNLSYMC